VLFRSLPYRPPRKPTQFQYEYWQTWGGCWSGLLGLALAGLFLFWPAFVWHGENGGIAHDGWSWDVHTTIACCVWWGCLVVVPLIIWGIVRGLRALDKQSPLIAGMIIAAVTVAGVALMVVLVISHRETPAQIYNDCLQSAIAVAEAGEPLPACPSPTP
jgi:hypothetical protein